MATSVIILIIFIASICVFIIENEKNDRLPSIYGWSILLFSSILALTSFFVDDGGISTEGIIGGVMYIGNVIGITIIVAYLALKKEKNLSTNWIDKSSLLAGVIIVLFWYISDNAYYTNIAAQVLMTIGYIVLINNIFKQKKCTEPFLFWGLGLLAGALSLIPVYSEDKFLAIINSWRVVILVSMVLSFMAYYRKDRTHLDGRKMKIQRKALVFIAFFIVFFAIGLVGGAIMSALFLPGALILIALFRAEILQILPIAVAIVTGLVTGCIFIMTWLNDFTLEEASIVSVVSVIYFCILAWAKHRSKNRVKTIAH